MLAETDCFQMYLPNDSSGINLSSATGNVYKLIAILTQSRIIVTVKVHESECHPVEVQNQHSSLFPPTVVVK